MMDLVLQTKNAILPSRSRFQLRQFVIGQHDTGPMQWRQIALEAQQLAYSIAMAELDIQRKEIEIKRLLGSSDELDAIEAKEKQLGIVLTERALGGARLELKWLQEIAMEVGQFTLDQIEKDQPEYWRLRLSRQAGLDQMSARQGIGAGNLQSMLSAGLLAQEGQCAILPGV
jgi:hypothetical protein